MPTTHSVEHYASDVSAVFPPAFARCSFLFAFFQCQFFCEAVLFCLMYELALKWNVCNCLSLSPLTHTHTHTQTRVTSSVLSKIFLLPKKTHTHTTQAQTGSHIRSQRRVRSSLLCALPSKIILMPI